MKSLIDLIFISSCRYPDSDDDELDEIERLRKAGPWQAPLHNRLRELLQERQNRRKKRLDIKL